MIRSSMTVYLIALFAASSLSAHEGMHGPGAEFDANVDGALSLQEFRNTPLVKDKSEEQIAALFAQLDVDGDRFLVSAEYLKGIAAEQ